MVNSKIMLCAGYFGLLFRQIDLLGMLIDLTRGKSEMLVENALLDSTIWILRSR